ncbi:MAG TPA: biotin--[acetyl-CoA-carboxylase] ligase [Desulfitobacteriaceae bacterium]|nr:biotin--[acetyl-CoA-carboxylase] ligase [Desulfitobacteriaceae bacterium]
MIRENILDFMAAHKGEYVSGELMSEQLHLTRAAIWKQIKVLREAGFEIEAQTKMGYRLLHTPLSIDAWIMKHSLKTRELGHKLDLHKDVTSTNERAKELAMQGVDHGTVVLAERQSSGRGRMQRWWEAPAGGLWMSVILKPKLSLADASKITLCTGVAVADAITEVCNIKVGIKWPNDLVYQGQKLVGILAEVVGEWNTVQTMVVGIGVNVNFTREELSKDLMAATLQDLTGTKWDLNVLAAKILERLEEELISLETRGFASLRERWMQRAVGIGQDALILQGKQTLEGIIQGISLDGELIVKIGAKNHVFSAGEVRVRSTNGTYF